jgi:DNA-binding NarL/FixJ family response regulator
MRVLMAVSRQEMRTALGLLLSQEPDIRLVGAPGNSHELLANLERLRPDVVLLDCDLPGLPTAELLAPIKAQDAKLKVLVLCSRIEEGQAAVTAGARTFVEKTSHPRQLLTALHVLQLESEYE